MFFNVALISSLLLVPAVLGVPSGLGARLARRREGRKSQISNSVEQPTDAAYNTVYTSNWAGAALQMNNGTFNTVTGTFTVPIPSGASGSSASAWVGIDGTTCTSAILQTGVDFTVSSGGEPTYVAWYEWLPGPSADFSGITFAAGDVVKLTITASSTTSGTATIENETNGQSVSKSLTSSTPLCGQDAEWIVEDYSVNGSDVPFADFGTVAFTNADASGTATYTPSGATIFEIYQNNTVLTSTSTSGSSVTIKYV